MTIIDAGTWTLAKRLQKSRQIADIGQTEIGSMLGVSRPTISNWERGVSEPSASQFVRWAEITGAGLDWLAQGVAVNDDKRPAEADRLPNVRPKGFEPLAF